MTEDTAVPEEGDEDPVSVDEPAPVAHPPAASEVVWSGIPIGDAFLHVVRADQVGPALQGRWAVVMDYARHGVAERILPASAFRYDRLPPRAALEVGVALFRELAALHSRAQPAATAQPLPTPARAGSTFAVARPPGPSRGTRHDSDVYAAAATVVELVTGQPVVGQTDGDRDAIEARIDASCDELRRRLGPSAASDAAVAILRVGLAHAPQDRPAAIDLAGALDDVARTTHGEGLDAFVRRAVLGASTPPPPPRPTPPAAVPRDRAPLRIPWVELGALLALAMAGGGLVTTLMLLMRWRG